MYGSKVPIARMSFMDKPEDLEPGQLPKMRFADYIAIVGEKVYTDEDSIAADGQPVVDRMRVVATGFWRDGYAVEDSPDKAAQRIVQEFLHMGYEIVPRQELPQLGIMTPEELTVHMYNHFSVTPTGE